MNPQQKKAVNQLEDMMSKYGRSSRDAIALVNVAEHMKKQDEEQSVRSRKHGNEKLVKPVIFGLGNFVYLNFSRHPIQQSNPKLWQKETKCRQKGIFDV